MEIDKNLKGKKGIYKLSIASHSYIGSSINLLHRLHAHFSESKRGSHHNKYLQNCVNKYGFELLTYSILEICNDDIEYIELLKKEKYYIEKENSDLNLKLDPTTQQGCITTITPVYQFDQFGKLLKKWLSESDAARFYNIDSSNIIKACKNPERQRLAAGFLWSYSNIYEFPLKIIYVYDLDGNFLSSHENTVSVYESYFSDMNRKTVLSQLKKKIDLNIPYKNIYLSTDPNFEVINKNLNTFNLRKWLNDINPLINTFNEKQQLILTKHYLDFKNKSSIFNKLLKIDFQELKKLKEINLYPDNTKKNVKIIVRELKTNKETKYNSITKAVIDIFGKFDKDIYKNITKHIKRKTPYKGFLFIRDF